MISKTEIISYLFQSSTANIVGSREFVLPLHINHNTFALSIANDSQMRWAKQSLQSKQIYTMINLLKNKFLSISLMLLAITIASCSNDENIGDMNRQSADVIVTTMGAFTNIQVI